MAIKTMNLRPDYKLIDSVAGFDLTKLATEQKQKKAHVLLKIMRLFPLTRFVRHFLKEN